MKRRIWLLAAVLAVGAFLAWRHWRGRGAGGEALAGGENPRLIVDQIWVDKDPETLKPGEYFNALVLLSEKQQGAYWGAVLKASSYDVHLRIFQYTRDQNAVRLKFMQEGERANFSYRIVRVADTPTMGLRLELSRNQWGGPKKYVGPYDPNGRRMHQLEEMIEHEIGAP
jgi:hypothetical protein